MIIKKHLKLDNILINGNGDIKIVDFGIAQILDNQNSKSTRIFTPDSASPEQINGECVDVRTDVFSLAVVFLELLVFEKPLPRINVSHYNSIETEKHINSLLKKSSLKPDLVNILKSALHIDLKKRYPSMEGFITDLNSYLENKPVNATPDGMYYRLQKFTKRNPVIVVSGIVITTVLFVSLFLIINYAQKANLQAQRSEKSLSFLTNILNNADPFSSNGRVNSIADALDSAGDLPVETLGGDYFIKMSLHREFGEIYANLGLHYESIEHLKNAIAASNKVAKSEIDINLIQKIKLHISQLYRELGRIDDSLDYSNQVLNYIKDHEYQNSSRLIDAKVNLMETYLLMDEEYYDKAKIIKNELIQMVSNEDIEDNEVLSNVLGVLAVEVQSEKNYKLAESYFLRSLNIEKQNSGESSIKYQTIFHNLAIS